MITLVLGAGASQPYGFPIGWELKDKILTEIGQQGRFNRSRFTEHLREICEFRGFSEIDKFAAAFSNSRMSSIDAFLQNRWTEFGQIGKASIALALVAYENPATLQAKALHKCWYSYLFAHHLSTLKQFNNPKIQVITFNYDRSLEFFLLGAVQNAFGIDEEYKAAGLVREIEILHAHGDLGILPGFEHDANKHELRPYAPEYSVPQIQEIMRRIQIVHEQGDYEAEQRISKIRKMLKSSTRIVFLGFSFHELNLRKLNILQLNHDHSRRETNVKKLCCNFEGMRPGEIETALTIMGCIGSRPELLIPVEKLAFEAYEFMRNTTAFVPE